MSDQESTDYAQAILDSTVEGIWTIGLDGLIKTVNKSAIRLFGYANAEQMIGRNSHELVHYKRADGTLYPQEGCPIYKAFQKGEPVHLEDEVLWRADGTSFYADYRSVPLFVDGKILGAVVTFLDNTEKRRTEQELRLNRSWLAAALRGIGDAVIATDASVPPKVTFLNPVAEKLLGWSLPEAKGKPVLDVFHIVHQVTRLAAENPIDRVLREGITVGLANHTVLISRDGHEYVIEDSAAPIRNDLGEIQGVVLVFRDTTMQSTLRTEKFAAVEQIERERSKLRAIFEQVPIPIAMVEGPDHKFLFANPVYQKYFLNDCDFVGKTVSELLPEAKTQGFIDLLNQVYRTGERHVGNETRFEFLTAVGTTKQFYLNFVYEPIRDNLGIIQGVLAAISDVTEQVEARRELEKAAQDLALERDKLAIIFRTSPAAMALWRGPDLVFEMVNPGYQALFEGRELIGKPLEKAMPQETYQKFPALIRKVLETGESFWAKEQLIRIERYEHGPLDDFYLDFVYVQITDQDGKPYGVYNHVMNVTDRVRARQKIDDSQNDLIDTLESMSDAFVSIDPSWNITRVNRNMEILSGLPRDALIGQNFIDKFQPENTEHYQKAMVERVSVSFEQHYESLESWMHVRAHPKKEGGLAIFLTDVTESKTAEAVLKTSEANFRAIAEAAPQMVLTADEAGMVDYANSQWYNYTGQTVEESMGVGFVAVLHPDDVEETMKRYQASLTNQTSLQIENRIRSHIDGSFRWFLVRAVPSFNDEGRATKWFGTITDIHEQKRVVEELAAAKLEADKANQTKSAFLANMSHEIRTPLGAIMGFADLLQDRNLDADDREQYLNTISRNGKSLTRIIDDILDLAKVESGKLEVEDIEFSFAELMSEVMDVFQERARSKGIYLQSTFERNVPTRIYSDPTRVRQILINIIGNAVKFTNAGGVHVQVQAHDEASGKVRFEILVVDTGVGLTDEQKSRLFQPFVQADNTMTRKFGGTGLGLILSRRLAQALNGDIFIRESGNQSGSTFSISFVAGRPAGHEVVSAPTLAIAHTSEKARPLNHVHVLLADDHEDNQFLVGLVLDKNGATYETADNGLEAFKKAMSGNFDIVLMDIQMPKMDGYAATKMLREGGYRKPIIALTAHAMAEERARTLAAGCNGHLTKPLNQVELVAMVLKHVLK